MKPRWNSPRRRGISLSALVTAALLAACPVSAQQTPVESTVTTYDKSYATFYNVMLLNDKILFYLPDDLADAPLDAVHNPPNVPDFMQWQYWDKTPGAGDLQVEIVSKHNRSQYPQTCTEWVEKPTIVYCGIEWDHLNIYHFFLDNFVRMFATITDVGAFDMEKFFSWSGLPTSAQANLVILTGRADSYTSNFAYLYQYLTPDLWAWPQGVGACYKQVTIGADNAPMTYQDSYSPEDQQRKVEIFTRFQRFALAAQLRNESLLGHAVPSQPLDNSWSGRVQISIVSRDRNHWSHRLLLNEESVARALRRRFAGKVDVRLVQFNGTLTEAMMNVQNTDILIGAHGAGLTNILWMKPGRVVIQLIPYGWERNPGKIRGYRQLAANLNCTHLVWTNKKAENAFFSRDFFTNSPKAFREHPDTMEVAAGGQLHPSGMLRDHYLYQDTHVDISSFLPVVDEAMKIVSKH